MKILRITPHYYFESDHWPSRFDPIGGMQNQITTLTNWLSDNAIEQDVLTTGFPGIKKFIKVNNFLRLHSVRFMTLPIKSKYDGTLFLNESWGIGVIKWILKNKDKNKFDLIHVHISGVSAPLIVAYLAQKILKIPLVVSVHCSRNFTYKPMNQFDYIIHPFIKKMEKNIIEKAEKTIFLTDNIKRKYESILEEKENLVVIPDCIAPHHLKSDNEYLLGRDTDIFPFNKNDKIILYVGRIAHEKGWETFVHMSKELDAKQDFKFIVCGDGPQREKMEAMVREFNLTNKYYFTGFVSRESIPNFMRKASVLVIPSKHEELGGIALEGAASGVPMVASNVGGLRNILSNEKNALLVNPEEYSNFANAVIRIITDKKLRAKLVESANQSIVKKFLPEHICSQVLECYQNILREKGREDESRAIVS
ncbi:glycosyltransferase family 4 protein [Bacillus cereus]|nr:glycosyltransferase family 4 protein [Bacillus cereus]